MTAFEPGRRLTWTHEAERLEGRPAPLFAASTELAVTLQPIEGGTLVGLRSRQVPAGALKGLVMRALGKRAVAGNLQRSLDRLASHFSEQADA